MEEIVDAEVRKALIRQFPEDRKYIVRELKELSRGNTAGLNHTQLAAHLKNLANIVLGWVDLADDSNAEHKCFPGKCENLVSQIVQVTQRLMPGAVPLYLKKMVYMIAIHVGRLTLRGWRDEEPEVDEDARRTERLQLFFEDKARETESEKDVIIRRYWGKLYIYDRECDCRQCMGGFRTTVIEEEPLVQATGDGSWAFQG